MKKKVKIIITILFVLALLIALVLGIKKISSSANKISQEYEEDKTLLQENYELFSDYIASYNQTRLDLVTHLESAEYYEDFPNVSSALETFFLEYDELINDIMKSVKNMDKSCKRDYVENEYNEMCNSYQLIYEKLINVYLEDINTYNELINNYNKWSNKEEYSLFISKYVNEYIDVNNDSVYEGKVGN